VTSSWLSLFNYWIFVCYCNWGPGATKRLTYKERRN